MHIRIHFNQIAVDLCYTYTFVEGTKVKDLYQNINRKMAFGFSKAWEEVRMQNLATADNSLEAVLEPGRLAKVLGFETETPKKDKNTLDLNKCDLDQDLWKLVDRTWMIQRTYTPRLVVKMPDHKLLKGKGKEKKKQEQEKHDQEQEKRKQEQKKKRDEELFGPPIDMD